MECLDGNGEVECFIHTYMMYKSKQKRLSHLLLHSIHSILLLPKNRYKQDWLLLCLFLFCNIFDHAYWSTVVSIALSEIFAIVEFWAGKDSEILQSWA